MHIAETEEIDTKMKHIWYIGEARGILTSFLQNNRQIHCNSLQRSSRQSKRPEQKTEAYHHHLATRRCESDDTHLLTNNLFKLHPMHIAEMKKSTQK